MFETRITEMFAIKYPILQGTMQWLSTAPLVAAVSEAGGLGILASAMFSTKEELREEIRKTKSLTSKPFAVNINLFPTMRPVDLEGYIDTALEEGVNIIETSGRSPQPYVERIKQGDVKLMHKVARARDARTAERTGCDAVTIVGFEGAGHPGMDDVPTMVHVPVTVDSVSIPVIAAGGIGDARGFVAALALGAEGVCLGTRFMASHECPVHPKFKEWMLSAQQTDTMIIERSIMNAARVVKNEVAQQVLEMENRGATLEELLPVISGERGRQVFDEGDLSAGTAACGEVVGLIHEVLSVREVIEGIISGAKAIIERMQALARP